jgi:hypothetical protein
VLVDLEAVPPDHEWIPVQTVFLAVLLIPLAAVWQLASGKPTGLFALLAPLVGVFVVAFYYSFDVYDGPPYYRNSEAGDMPALAVYLGTLGALATGSWLAPGLPFLAVALSLPFGYPSGDHHEPLPIWFSTLLLAPVEAVVVVLGVTSRKLWDRWHRAAVA